MSLNELFPGAEGVIHSLDVHEKDAAMLRAMGVVEGHPVRVLRRAPFGGPLQVRIGGADFALARSVAGAVSVRTPEKR